jgi:hypothetical protein
VSKQPLLTLLQEKQRRTEPVLWEVIHNLNVLEPLLYLPKVILLFVQMMDQLPLETVLTSTLLLKRLLIQKNGLKSLSIAQMVPTLLLVPTTPISTFMKQKVTLLKVNVPSTMQQLHALIGVWMGNISDPFAMLTNSSSS